MKNAAESAKKLTALLKKIGPVEPPALPNADDPVAVLVFSMLLWNTTTEQAQTGYGRITAAGLDWNELRINLPQETVEVIGASFPRADERARMIRRVLHALYEAEHAVSLERLVSLGKRDVRKFIDGLDGMPPFVAARTLLLGFDAHATPVDDRLLDALRDEGVADDETTIDDLDSWLTRQVKAAEGRDVYFALQHWADQYKPKKRKKKTTRKSSSKKTSKKSSTRKTTTKKKTTRPSSTTKKKTTGRKTSSKKTTRKKTAKRSKSGA